MCVEDLFSQIQSHISKDSVVHNYQNLLWKDTITFTESVLLYMICKLYKAYDSQLCNRRH